MPPRLKSALSHGGTAYLFALGMVLTLLGVTGLLRHGWLAAWVLLGLCGVCGGAGMNRRLALGAICLALFAGAIWLLIGGAGMIAEVSRALILHMSGLTTALPMVGAEFTVLISLLCLGVSWFVTQRSAGAFPALILLILAAVLLWLGDWPDMLVCLLPSVLSCVTLMLRAGDEHTSTLRVFPLAALVTGVAFLGVWLGGATAEPLKTLADEVRQRIYDTFFYTQPRDVFTLATEGYYPQGLGQLGGPAEPREDPVMAVITPKKAYLRGVVKNVYTGRTWVDDIGGRRYLMSSSRFEELRTETFDQSLPLLDSTEDTSLLTPQRLQVRMLRDSASTMFVPQRLRSLSVEGQLTPYFNASSEVFATSNLEPGDVWTVEAALFTAQDAEIAALVEAAAGAPDPHWEEVCDTYLQLPEHLEQQVYDLAIEAVAGANTPYEKAQALQWFLAANYTYTLDAPVQNPEQDFVSAFLLIGKEGYCTYFASAMTVLCRMVGLPARYVEGYVAYPDAEGLAVVTGMEGHAWTEVYFSGFGWVTFDATPTSVDTTGYAQDDASDNDAAEENPQEDEEQPDDAGQPTPTPEPPQEEPTPTPEPEEEPEGQPQPTEAPSEEPEPQVQPQPDPPADVPWGWLLTLLLLVLLAVRAVLVQPAIQAARQRTEFGCWLVWTQAVHDALRRMGLRRDKAESPTAFFRRVERSGLMRFSLQGIAEAENMMFYGHAAPLEEEIRQAQAAFQVLYRKLNPWQKLVFQLQRICLPARRFDFTKA